MTKTDKYQIDMCSGPILPKMLKFTLPLMAASLLQLLFNAADIIVVGKFCGDNSMAAVGSNGALVNLMTNFFIGLSTGVNVLAARYYGSKSDEDLSKTVHTSLLLSLIGGVALTFIGLFGAIGMLEVMSTPEEILPLATLYLRIYFIGMPSVTIYNFGSAILRSIGDTKRPLYYLATAGVLNVILNIIFVIVFRMDVAGVALATILTQTLSAYLIVRCLMRETGAIKLELKKLRIDKTKLLQIIRIGLPSGLQGTLFSLSNVVIQSSINLFGDVVVAGNAAAGNLEGFVYVAMNSFAQAVVSFTSQNFGRHNFKRIVRIQLIGQACAVVTGLILGNTLTFLGNKLLWIYSDTQAVVDAGLIRFDYVATPYFLCGIMDCLSLGMRGIGYSILPMVVSLAGACGFRLVWLATIFKIPAFHVIETVYISYPISWILTALVHLLCFVIAMKKLRKRYPDGESLQTEIPA